MLHGIQLEDNDIPANPVHITSVDLTVQSIRNRLSAIVGDWFLDLRDGIAYDRFLSRRVVPQEALRAQVRNRLRGSYGVQEVTSVQSSTEGNRITVTARAVVEDQQLTIEVEAPRGGNVQPAFIMIS